MSYYFFCFFPFLFLASKEIVELKVSGSFSLSLKVPPPGPQGNNSDKAAYSRRLCVVVECSFSSPFSALVHLHGEICPRPLSSLLQSRTLLFDTEPKINIKKSNRNGVASFIIIYLFPGRPCAIFR